MCQLHNKPLPCPDCKLSLEDMKASFEFARALGCNFKLTIVGKDGKVNVIR